MSRAYGWNQQRPASLLEKEDGEESEDEGIPPPLDHTVLEVADTESVKEDPSVVEFKTDTVNAAETLEDKFDMVESVEASEAVEGSADASVEPEEYEYLVTGDLASTVNDAAPMDVVYRSPDLISRLETFIIDLRTQAENEAVLLVANNALTAQNAIVERHIAELLDDNQSLKRKNEELTETIERVQRERDEFRADFEIYKDAARAKFMKA